MLGLPPALADLIHQLTRLPGIGPKSAQRITFYLLRATGDQARGGEAFSVKQLSRLPSAPHALFS